MSWSGRS